MALRYIDSFDHYLTADITEKWSTSSIATISAGNGRRGTACGRLTVGNGRFFGMNLDSQPTWIVGMACRISALPTSSNTALIYLGDSGNSQVAVLVTNTGQLAAARAGTILGTSTAQLVLNVYHYIELFATIHNTAGVMIIRLNGVEVVALTGQDTYNTGLVSANQIRVGCLTGTSDFGNVDIDDLYLCDGTGTAPHNTLLGDCRVDLLLPSGDSTPLAWTPSTGTTHFTLMDEATPNDDTDYVSTLTVSARDMQVFPDLPVMTNPSIVGVQHSINARKDDVGTRQLKNVLTSGATTQVGATTHTIASTYAYYREVWPLDPATGLAWTVPGVNALEAGFDNLL